MHTSLLLQLLLKLILFSEYLCEFVVQLNLPNQDSLVALTKGMEALKICVYKILQLLTAVLANTG